MRVITGKARGRKLREPEGTRIRPTTDRVKEAMFSICQFDLEGRRVLDLFGGTGQLGIEAASRGAGEVTVVDQSREALALIRENVRRAGVTVQVCQSEALAFLERCGSYDLIFLDPPYDSELTKNALFRVKTFDILTNGGIIICESRVETELPELEAPYRKLREYRYGRVKLTTYTKDA